MIAEKLEAMVVLGDRNSRIKDFFDLYHLASEFEFDRATLVEAVRRTFPRRQTAIPNHDPVALTKAYWENPMRPAQMRAFARRAGLSPDLGLKEG
ncbi:MAG TPA: nucleotidyl transferase AbiEii/AbiGii toxin family protein, partial [Steroidobacteraceae bacterium]|nr:nucleotidyl transferase AbiEii/AbiGii toxin family protein [Steroidobacteraceae bacterium]